MTSFLIRVNQQPHLNSDRVQFFVGVDPDHRQLAGEIILRPQEVNDLLRATNARPKRQAEPLGRNVHDGDWVFTRDAQIDDVLAAQVKALVILVKAGGDIRTANLGDRLLIDRLQDTLAARK